MLLKRFHFHLEIKIEHSSKNIILVRSVGWSDDLSIFDVIYKLQKIKKKEKKEIEQKTTEATEKIQIHARNYAMEKISQKNVMRSLRRAFYKYIRTIAPI